MAVSVGDAVLVVAAGLGAGVANAMAGGGTLITFSALVATGLGARTASMTSAVGLIWGYAGGTLAYRPELVGQRVRLRVLGATSACGGIVGALALLITPESSFEAVVPYLVLLSSGLLAVQPRLAAAFVRRRTGRSAPAAELGLLLLVTVFAASVYGSYFGGGLGVVLLAVLGTLLSDGIQRTNALKGALSFVVNSVGVLVFVVSGSVVWSFAALLAIGAFVGGTVGARVAQRLPAHALRTAVVVFAIGVAVAMLLT